MKTKSFAYRNEGWKTTVARVRLLTEEGVMSSQSWEQTFLDELEQVEAAEVEESFKRLNEMRRIQESSPHERLRDDRRFLYGKQTSAEALLLANFSTAGLKVPDDLDWLDGRGDELGCAYRNCPFSLKNMCTTGLSPGVCTLGPLFSDTWTTSAASAI